MTLPKKEEKSYLEVVPRTEGFAIIADKQCASELAVLFLQYGISCERRQVTPGADELLFLAATNKAEVQRILDGYKSPKGS